MKPISGLALGVLLMTALANPAVAQPVELSDEADVEQDAGLLERFYPLTVDDSLHPAADSSYSLFFLGAMLPLGSMWLPPLFTDADTPLGYYTEAPLIALAHLAPHLALLSLLPCSLLGASIVGGPVLVVAGLMVQFVNLGCCIANLGYFVPVAMINAYNRGLRADAETAPAEPDQGGGLLF